MFVYSYPKHIIDLLQFDNYVKSSDFPTFEYSISEIDNNIVHIYFSNSLTKFKQNTLGNLVAVFTEKEVMVEQTCTNILTSQKTTNNTVWNMISSWNYPGKYNTVYKSINMYSYISDNNSLETYSIRLYDATNNSIITEYTSNNTELSLQKVDIADIALPNYISTFELHAKVSNPSTILTIKNFCIIS